MELRGVLPERLQFSLLQVFLALKLDEVWWRFCEEEEDDDNFCLNNFDENLNQKRQNEIDGCQSESTYDNENYDFSTPEIYDKIKSFFSLTIENIVESYEISSELKKKFESSYFECRQLVDQIDSKIEQRNLKFKTELQLDVLYKILEIFLKYEFNLKFTNFKFKKFVADCVEVWRMGMVGM